jgi:hypothetical protein
MTLAWHAYRRPAPVCARARWLPRFANLLEVAVGDRQRTMGCQWAHLRVRCASQRGEASAASLRVCQMVRDSTWWVPSTARTSGSSLNADSTPRRKVASKRELTGLSCEDRSRRLAHAQTCQSAHRAILGVWGVGSRNRNSATGYPCAHLQAGNRSLDCPVRLLICHLAT